LKKNTADERRSARANVLRLATVESGSGSVRVRIANLSAHGALVIGEGLPAAENPVTLRSNGITVSGWIAWSRPQQAGIQFDEAVPPEVLLRNAVPGPQMIMRDTRQVDFRRPGFRGNQLTDEERVAVEQWRDRSNRSSD
jgi:hypothetical protein